MNTGHSFWFIRWRSDFLGSMDDSCRWVLGSVLINLLTVGVIFSSVDDKNDEVIEISAERGPVDATVRLEPATPLIGDYVTLTLEVLAEKGVELLMPEFGDALDRFQIVDFAPRQEIDDTGHTRATQTYRLETATSGQQVIPAILIEFVDRRPGQRLAPEDQDAYELLTEPLIFHVQSVIPDDAKADLRPPLGHLEPLSETRSQRWVWGLAGTLLTAGIVAGAVALWRVRKNRQRRQTAYELARRRLDRLLLGRRRDFTDAEAFFVELSDIVRHYLEDGFQLRAPELTTEEFLNLASGSPDLTRDHQQQLRQFLRQADLVKFAGMVPEQDEITRCVEVAQHFLDETRDDDKLVEASVPQSGEVTHV